MPQVSEVRPETGRLRVQTVNDEESKTVQSDRLEAEMRSVLGKYRELGIIEHLREVDLVFKDVSEFEDFSDLMRQTKVAEQTFMELPSKVRELFHHDVNEWLDVAHDADKLEALTPKLQELGMIPKPAEPVPQQVEVVARDPETGRFVSTSGQSESSSSD